MSFEHLADTHTSAVPDRHDATQRSAVAAELANMQNGGWRGNQWQTANLQSATTTQTEAATLLNVSPRSVATASKVKDESPEIFAAMKSPPC
jgi:hypothetical protein